jgi:DNA-directed RNA polymerase subunit F
MEMDKIIHKDGCAYKISKEIRDASPKTEKELDIMFEESKSTIVPENLNNPKLFL